MCAGVFHLKYLLCMVACCACVACDDMPSAPVPPDTARTIIAYLIADNNLESYAWEDINEMERALVAHPDEKLVVYIDGGESSYPSHPVLLEIAPDDSPDIVSEVTGIWAEHDSAILMLFMRY